MGGLFGSPKMPKVKPSPRMPVQEDEASRQARIRRSNDIRSQEGRQSTDLSGQSGDLLGE
jgi:hypothetical protein